MPAELEAALAKAWVEVLGTVGWGLCVIAAGGLFVIAVCALISLSGAGRGPRARTAAVTRIGAYTRGHCAGAQTTEPRAEEVDFVLRYLLAERVQGGQPRRRQVYRN